MKSNFRIGGSIALGIFIVLGASYINNNKVVDATDAVVVAEAPPRTYIATKDSNEDGTPDWEDDLEAAGFTAVSTPESTAAFSDEDEPYSPPETFTGKFSEAFFQDYLEGKMKGEDFSDPSKLIGNAITAIDQNTLSKTYTRSDVNVRPSTPASLKEYGNRVAEIVNSYSASNENEALILERALKAGDPKILEALVPIHTAYIGMLSDTLRMEVPSNVVTQHLDLLNAYEAIKTDVEAMQVAFTDPLYSLARIRGYQDDAGLLFTAFKSIGLSLRESAVTYDRSEPGSFYKLLGV